MSDTTNHPSAVPNISMTVGEGGRWERSAGLARLAAILVWSVVVPFGLFVPISVYGILGLDFTSVDESVLDHVLHVAALLSACALLLAAFHRPFRPALGQVVVAALIVFGTYIVFIVFSRYLYIRPVLLVAVAWSVVTLIPFVRIMNRLDRGVVGLIPTGDAIAIAGPFQNSVVTIPSPEAQVDRFSVIAADFSRPMDPRWTRFVARAMMSRRRVLHVAELHEYETRKVAISHFEPEHAGDVTNQLQRTLKRWIDIAIVVLAAPFALVLVALAAIAIYLESGKPVLFKQRRLGLNNEPFTIYKLRTMVEADRVEAAKPGDARVTRLGAILRRTRIDELPQLWNILRGEMSFVGPRPEWDDLVDRYLVDIPEYNFRHLVLPGLTGWAQVKGGASSTVEEAREKLQYDLYYVKHQTLLFDLEIFARTVLAMLWGRNIR